MQDVSDDGNEIKNLAARKFFDYWEGSLMRITNDGMFLEHNRWYGFGRYESFFNSIKNAKVIKEASIDLSFKYEDVGELKVVDFGGHYFQSMAIYEATLHLVRPRTVYLMEREIEEDDAKRMGYILFMVDSNGDCVAVANRKGSTEKTIVNMEGIGDIEIEPLIVVAKLDDCRITTADPFGEF